jgi:hypothetical protein
VLLDQLRVGHGVIVDNHEELAARGADSGVAGRCQPEVPDDARATAAATGLPPLPSIIASIVDSDVSEIGAGNDAAERLEAANDAGGSPIRADER